MGPRTPNSVKNHVRPGLLHEVGEALGLTQAVLGEKLGLIEARVSRRRRRERPVTHVQVWAAATLLRTHTMTSHERKPIESLTDRLRSILRR